MDIGPVKARQTSKKKSSKLGLNPFKKTLNHFEAISFLSPIPYIFTYTFAYTLYLIHGLPWTSLQLGTFPNQSTTWSKAKR